MISDMKIKYNSCTHQSSMYQHSLIDYYDKNNGEEDYKRQYSLLF